jgi:putative SOS response-associated peptidase YedK
MCGRFQLTLPVEALRRLFEFGEAEPFPPRYNIAPTQPVHVVAPDGRGGRRLALMRWGLLPSWVKDPNAFPLLINARAETAANKPAFRNALRRRRVLLPATGFYEWRREGRGKTPVLFEPDEPMALAGVFETWCGPDGEEMDTVAILTTTAEGTPAAVHDRMPLTVPAEAWALWLDPANDDGAAALTMARRAAYRARPVSRRLSNARNEGAGLMEPDVEPDREPEPAPPAARAAPARDGDTQPDLFG